MFVVTYPPDYFYPFTIIVPIKAGVLYLVILWISRIIFTLVRIAKLRREDFRKAFQRSKNLFQTPTATDQGSKDKFKSTEVMIALAGTAGTIFGGSIYTIMQFPILDYRIDIIEDSQNIGKFDVVVKNMGTTAAKNIMISVHITDAKFIDIYSTPYLPDSVNKSSTIDSNAYARIKLLPPNAEIKITALVDSMHPIETQVITPFVFSDEGVGRFNQSAVILFYLLLVVIFALIYYVILRRIIRTGRSGTGQNLVGLMILLGYMGIFYLLYSLIYGVIGLPSISFPSISFHDLNLPDLPPVK
jgi:hypothetical protein